MIHKDTRLIIFITLICIIPLFTHAQSWAQMENDYNSFLKNKQNDLAVSKAREMYSWAMKSEGDTSIYLPISLKLIGSAYKNSDSAIFYYDSALNVIEKQNRKYHIQSAKLHYNKSLRYSKEKNIDLSLQESEEAISILEKLEYPEYPFSDWALTNAGNICREMKKNSQAENYFKKSLEIIKKNVGELHQDYLKGLNNLGSLYEELGDYKSAEMYYKQASDISKKVLGEENIDYASSLNSLGFLYYSMGNFRAAEPYYKQALDTYKKVLGEEHIDYARSLSNLGLLYHSMGDFKMAEQNYLEAIEIQKKVIGEEHLDFEWSLTQLGILYSDMGYYKSAEPYFIQALEITLKVLGQQHADYARKLTNLGILYSDMGNYKVAESYYQQSLDIQKIVLGPQHPDYAISLNSIGNIYTVICNYKAAESCFKQGLEIQKKVLGVEHPHYAQSLNNLGVLYADMGNYKAAESCYYQSMEIRKKVLGEDHRDYAASLNNIGLLYADMGNYKAAESFYKQALEIQKKNLGEEHPDYSTSLTNLGVLFSDIGDYKSSEHCYIQAMEIIKKVLGQQHPDYARKLGNLGNLYFDMGDYKAAEPYYKQALEIQKKVLGEEHPEYAWSLNNLGFLYSYLGSQSSAEILLKESFEIRIGNLYKNFSWLSTQEKDVYWQQENNFYNNMHSFCASSPLTVPASSVLSYNASLVSKSLLLENSIELDQVISNSSDQLLKEQFTEMKQLRRLVNKMQSEGSDKKEIIQCYNQKADSLDKILVNKMGEYANAKRKFEITWKDVQANLLTTDAAIEFARYYDYKDSTYKYMALVVRPEFKYPKLVKLSSELSIKNSSSQKEISELYNYVWRGIDSLLFGVKTIYYSPVGELNNVSFSALMSETNNQSDSSKSNWSYLIDRYDLHQVTTTRYLADGTLNKNDSLPLSIKLIGGVNYSDLPLSKDSIEKNETTEDFALQINLQNEVIDPKSNRGGKISYLKGSEIEVKEIAKTLKNSGWVTTISDGKNAGEYQFKQELKEKSPGVIHIATHGFAFPEKEINVENKFLMQENTPYKISEDPMVRCGLMLSGANVSWSGDSKKMIETTGDDGILTAAEVSNLDLSNTKLVVLSACETGLGKIESSEGTFGLKRGFKLAGVDQMIVSLWKVPDTESMELMTLFYSDLAKTNNPEVSFNFAQKAMRNKFPYEPEKWAGFVFVR